MDIDLYVDRVYYGFYPISTIEERFEEQKQLANELAADIDEGEVIVYAIFNYEPDSERIVSLELITERLDYDDYVRSYQSFSGYCRAFFVRKTNGGNNEE